MRQVVPPPAAFTRRMVAGIFSLLFFFYQYRSRYATQGVDGRRESRSRPWMENYFAFLQLIRSRELTSFFVSRYLDNYIMKYQDPRGAGVRYFFRDTSTRDNLWGTLTFITAYCTSSSEWPNRRKEFDTRTR